MRFFSTRVVTTTRLALVTTTAQVTATRVNVDSETVTQYSGTVTTINPDYATTELGPGTTTVTTSLPSVSIRTFNPLPVEFVCLMTDRCVFSSLHSLFQRRCVVLSLPGLLE